MPEDGCCEGVCDEQHMFPSRALHYMLQTALCICTRAAQHALPHCRVPLLGLH